MQEPKTGRPRDARLHQAILKTAFDSVLESGFRSVSIESIAARAGVGKTTIYRRWPNKAAVVMDAFTAVAGSGTLFPEHKSAAESIRLQMRSMAISFRGTHGVLVKALLAEAQFDPELAKAFRARWTVPRRKLGIGVVERAIREGSVRPEVDPEEVIDLLYGPIYYRLQMGTGPLSIRYVETIFRRVMQGIATPSALASRSSAVSANAASMPVKKVPACE